MRHGRGIQILGVAAAVGLLACQDRSRVRRVAEDYVLVPGVPEVQGGTPAVDQDSTRATNDLAVNTARQCDVFQQVAVRKVDILWVVDSSGSMGPKQARLASNFSTFIGQLTAAQPPIDFHIAVVSTDTDDPSTRGVLRSWTLGNPAVTANYIACTPQAGGGSLCNTAANVSQSATSAAAAFTQMATVGTSGSPVERGLLAAYLALTNPLNVSDATAQRFIRPEAALYVVVVSDEDDASCTPTVIQPNCTTDPGCGCASDSILKSAGGYGSADYFSRFLETYKGFGNGGLVALAAIVALPEGLDAGVPSQFGDPSAHTGCCRALDGGSCPTAGANDGGFEIAYSGTRYRKVADATGGVAVSICQDDFSGALASLGYAASGLRREFRLSRVPLAGTVAGKHEGLHLSVASPTAPACQVQGNCVGGGELCRNGRCAQPRAVFEAPLPNEATYVRCDGPLVRNVIRFDGASVPASQSMIEVCYDVQPTAQLSCP